MVPLGRLCTLQQTDSFLHWHIGQRHTADCARPCLSSAHPLFHLQWPGVTAVVKPANAGLRLFGGAAFERVLAEFQEAAKLLEFPSVQRDRVANILLAYKSRWVGAVQGEGKLGGGGWAPNLQVA